MKAPSADAARDRNTRSASPNRPGGPTTRELLIATAETLFGQKGLDAVSLRQIGSTAGYVNPNVVGYHFKTKEDLIVAIMESRMALFERPRFELLELVKQDNKTENIRSLLEVLWLPYLDVKDDAGSLTYARFLLSCVANGVYVERFSLSDYLDTDFPVLFELVGLITASLPYLSLPVVKYRVMSTTMHFVSALMWLERKQASGGCELSIGQLVDDALQVGALALSAPPAKSSAITI